MIYKKQARKKHVRIQPEINEQDETKTKLSTSHWLTWLATGTLLDWMLTPEEATALPLCAPSCCSTPLAPWAAQLTQLAASGPLPLLLHTKG